MQVEPVSPERPLENSTDPVVRIEITEGTEIVFRPERCSETDVAAVPERGSSPETEFIERLAAPETCDEDDDESVLVAAQGQSSPLTVRTPHQRRVRRWLFTAAIVVLVAVIVASMSEISELVSSEDNSVAGANGDDPGPEPEGLGQRKPPTPPPARETTELAELRRGDDADMLLTLNVQEIDDQNRRVALALRNGPITEGHVTVVNLWATYCGPCKSELPGLKAMFEESGWGDEVRFVPVLDSDSRDTVWARNEFLPKMPATEHFLVDQDGRVRDALRRFVKVPKKSRKEIVVKGSKEPRKQLPLPVTVVFDCQRDLRQLYPGALLEPDLLALRGQIDQLRKELGTSYCKPQPKRKAAVSSIVVEPKPELRARCGDGECTRPEESETNCCECLECPDTDRCIQESGAPRCIPTTGNLKL